MSKLGNAKILGGVGAILTLVGAFIPVIGTILPLVGVILIFIAVKYIADETKESGIFRNYLVSFIFRVCSIIAGIAVAVIIIGSVSLGAMFNLNQFTNPRAMFNFAGGILAGIIIGLIVIWVFLILSSVYLRKSYNSIAKHTKVDLFRTTGMLYFIGAITLIVLIGFLILLIAVILEIVSYFSLPEKLPVEAQPVPAE